jgi:hypothetical protein
MPTAAFYVRLLYYRWLIHMAQAWQIFPRVQYFYGRDSGSFWSGPTSEPLCSYKIDKEKLATDNKSNTKKLLSELSCTLIKMDKRFRKNTFMI